MTKVIILLALAVWIGVVVEGRTVRRIVPSSRTGRASYGQYESATETYKKTVYTTLASTTTTATTTTSAPSPYYPSYSSPVPDVTEVIPVETTTSAVPTTPVPTTPVPTTPVPTTPIPTTPIPTTPVPTTLASTTPAPTTTSPVQLKTTQTSIYDATTTGAPVYYYPTTSSYTKKESNHHNPMPYKFAWAVKDEPSANDYSHQQESDGSVVIGSYRVLLPDGRTQIVTYRADENGYVADVKYQGEAQYPSTNNQSKTTAATKY